MVPSWGKNNVYQLGDGTTNSSLTPKQVGTDSNWKTIDGQLGAIVGLKTDGTLWRWGDDSQIAGGGVFPVPTQLGTDTDWVEIMKGAYTTMALKSDGSRWAYGTNNFGALGSGEQYRGFPSLTKVDGNLWKDLAGGVHIIGIRADGSIYGWGSNDAGQTGTGSNTSVLYNPTLIDNTHAWKVITTGNNGSNQSSFSLAIRDDNTLWAWGGGTYEQLTLGKGNKIPTNVPVQVGTETDWISVSAGGSHSAGIRSNHTLWTWGIAENGQLGVPVSGSYTLNPVQVGCPTALPVTLQRFSAVASEASVNLAWVTATEKNTNRFEIQRSSDGESWTVVGTQKAKGESTTMLSYRFIDPYPSPGISYYRLAMIDNDGTFDYSRTQSVIVKYGTPVLYPNPANKVLFVSNIDVLSVKEIAITNARGLTVYQSPNLTDSGIDVSSLPTGLYFLTITRTDGYTKTHKLIVSK